MAVEDRSRPESGEISFIVVDPGLFRKSLVVPTAFVTEIHQEGIILGIDEDELEQIPHYAPRRDEEIEADVDEQLLKQLPHHSGIEVGVKNGVATMTGTAPDPKVRRQLEAVVRSVEGVIDVDDKMEVGTTV